MVRCQRGFLAGALILTLVPHTARAHEIAGRFTAPLPLGLLFGGAAATVALTAVLLALTVTDRPMATDHRLVGRIPEGIESSIVMVSRWGFFLAFCLTILTGLFGRQVPAENFATIFFWAVWLKGVAFISAVVGSPWPRISPWKTIYDTISRLENRPIRLLGGYPVWLGAVPALAGFLLVVGILENLSVVPRSPRLTALLLTVYTLTMLVGGLAFGPAWFREADVFAVLFRLFGRVAPVSIEPTDDAGCRVTLRWPWTGCLQEASGIPAAVFVIAMVFTVSFDGFISTPEYQAILFTISDDIGATTLTGGLLYLVGITGFGFVFGMLAAVSQHLSDPPASKWTASFVAYAPSVLPIAVAYEIAHNYPFVISNAGRLIAVLWPWFGGEPGLAIDVLAWLSLSAYWWSQVLLIVGGHLVAVVAAHAVAVSRSGPIMTARRELVPLTSGMIVYTVLSLWIVSRPIVT